MTTWQHLGRVVLETLLLGNGASKDGMEIKLWRQLDLDGHLVIPSEGTEVSSLHSTLGDLCQLAELRQCQRACRGYSQQLAGACLQDAHHCHTTVPVLQGALLCTCGTTVQESSTMRKVWPSHCSGVGPSGDSRPFRTCPYSPRQLIYTLTHSEFSDCALLCHSSESR